MSAKTVFISYRRDSTGRAFARSLKQELTHHGYDVFFDVDSIDAGKWADQISKQVPARSHFLLLITPGALDRCEDQNDWVRREFETAVQSNRNIVPVREESVDLNKLREDCPESMKGVLAYQIATVQSSDFERDVETLIERYIPPHKAPAKDGETSKCVVSATRLHHGADHLFGRDDELAALDQIASDPAKKVLTIVAFGGVGKTSLVIEWMARQAAKNWQGFERVFDWSFFSQGTREQGDASAEGFVAEALRFFGDEAMAQSATSAWDKGARLAQLVAQKRTLLVLDGVEPLQHPPGPLAGELKDPAFATLLKGLARSNSGLCIVITRERVADLASFRDTTAPEWQLHHLSIPAGVELLKTLGVRGTAAEFQELVEDVKGHALTLNLFGAYLARVHGGDIRKRDLVGIVKADAALRGGDAFRIMSAYERHLSEQFAIAVREDIKSKSPSVFLSHASEDKDSFARPLAIALRQRGMDVWYDEFVLKLGDSIRGKIDRGLADCDFAVAILSENFFRKSWPQQEVSGLTAREVAEKRKIILPIWHGVSLEGVTRYSPLLADRLAVSSSKGVDVVAEDILATVSPQFHPVALVQRSEELLMLRLFGLFDRPVSYHLLRVILEPPEIPDLTEGIVGLSRAHINQIIHQLQEFGLIYAGSTALYDDDVVVDLHPLVREYFSVRLKEECLSSFEEAHSRLFNHFRQNSEYRPSDLEGLIPLYEAVVHGCLAGRHKEAKEVYLDRILRGTGPDGAYSTRALGALGPNLNAVAHFFEIPWTEPVKAFSKDDQAWLLNEAAWLLRAVGRLTEALEPMRVATEIRVEREDWVGCAVSLSNLSELELSLGKAAGAVGNAERSVAYADRSGDSFWKKSTRATHADALHQTGRRTEAEMRFREAEQIQTESQPEYPLLYSRQGFQYCELLLASAERTAWEAVLQRAIRNSELMSAANSCRFVEQRATRSLLIAEHNMWLLDIGFDRLTLGRASLYASILNPTVTTNRQSVIENLKVAVDGLRRAGQQDELPLSLLSRAWLRCLIGEATGPESAQADLDEAWEIAERGPMRLHLADIHLYRARLFYSVKPYPWTSPQEDLAAARKLIEQCGYWRRKEELEDAEAAAKNW